MMVRPTVWRPGLVLHVKPVTYRGADYCSRRVAAIVEVVDPANRTRIELASRGRR